MYVCACVGMCAFLCVWVSLSLSLSLYLSHCLPLSLSVSLSVSLSLSLSLSISLFLCATRSFIYSFIQSVTRSVGQLVLSVAQTSGAQCIECKLCVYISLRLCFCLQTSSYVSVPPRRNRQTQEVRCNCHGVLLLLLMMMMLVQLDGASISQLSGGRLLMGPIHQSVSDIRRQLLKPSPDQDHDLLFATFN